MKPCRFVSMLRRIGSTTILAAIILITTASLGTYARAHGPSAQQPEAPNIAKLDMGPSAPDSSEEQSPANWSVTQECSIADCHYGIRAGYGSAIGNAMLPDKGGCSNDQMRTLCAEPLEPPPRSLS